MKTYMANANNINREWYVVDAKDKTLGRLSSEIAKILRGKHKAEYTPHVDTGDYIIVINAEKVHLTGKKLDNEVYRYHTGHPGGLKEISYRRMINEKPEMFLTNAVKGMLPKNRLGRQMIKKLKVYAGENHDHEAQQPKHLDL